MVIVISNTRTVVDEQVIINQLFDEGLEIFHVRKKNYSESETRKFIENISEKHFKKIVLHSHYPLAEEYNLKGIHIPIDYRNEARNKIVSVSFHSLEEVKKFDKKIDYAFLSPVFDSISKEGYKSKFRHRLHEFSQIKSELISAISKKNIIALGGIDEDKINTVKELNFSGIALLGAIWQNTTPVEKFKRIKEKWLQKEIVY